MTATRVYILTISNGASQDYRECYLEDGKYVHVLNSGRQYAIDDPRILNVTSHIVRPQLQQIPKEQDKAEELMCRLAMEIRAMGATRDDVLGQINLALDHYEQHIATSQVKS